MTFSYLSQMPFKSKISRGGIRQNLGRTGAGPDGIPMNTLEQNEKNWLRMMHSRAKAISVDYSSVHPEAGVTSLKNHRRHLRQLDVVLCLMYERYIFQICRIYALQIFYGKVSWKLYVISNWRSISTAHLCWCLSCCSRTHSRGKISDSYTRWHQVTSHCVL